MKIALDHLGWLAPDVHRLVAVFTALGFRVVGPVPLQAGVASHPDVQWSAHVMFRDTYLELTSVSAAAADNPLQRWRTSPAGVRLVVLRTGDADAMQARLAAAGWRVTDVQHAQRRLAYGGQGVARFRWFGLRGEPLPGTLAAWVQHLDREALFDASVSVQPNTVHGIEALHHAAGQWPDALADENAGNVELRRFDPVQRDASAVTGVDFVALDLDACARAMRSAGVPFSQQREYLQVSADDAAGTLLRFREAAPAAPSARPPAGGSTGPSD